MPRTRPTKYKRKYGTEHNRRTVLQRDTIKQYGQCICTRCGQNPITSDQCNTYYKGVRVRIMLCATCVPIIIQRLIDVSIEGHEHDALIDSLTKYGQI